jgi:hypothetical protein
MKIAATFPDQLETWFCNVGEAFLILHRFQYFRIVIICCKRPVTVDYVTVGTANNEWLE